jgi:hypothetical protein
VIDAKQIQKELFQAEVAKWNAITAKPRSDMTTIGTSQLYAEARNDFERFKSMNGMGG